MCSSSWSFVSIEYDGIYVYLNAFCNCFEQEYDIKRIEFNTLDIEHTLNQNTKYKFIVC